MPAVYVVTFVGCINGKTGNTIISGGTNAPILENYDKPAAINILFQCLRQILTLNWYSVSDRSFILEIGRNRNFEFPTVYLGFSERSKHSYLSIIKGKV